VTNDSTPTISGTAEAGSTITVIIDGVAAGTTTTDGSGTWTFTPGTALADGQHTVVTTATDEALHVSPDSNSVTFTVDTVAPAAPVITSPTSGTTTDDTTPTISGTAEAGSSVTVIVNGAVVGTATADSQGNWTLTPTSPLAAGTELVTATATDQAGNIGPASATVTLTITLATVTPGSPVSPTGTLPVTGGGDMVVGWLIGSLLIGLGALGLLMARRRRIS
jgi:hypothetical protein